MEDGPRRGTAPLDAGEAEELRSLRRRAFSPDADIHLDARALARLDELEARALPSPPPPPPAPAPAPLAGPGVSPPHPSATGAATDILLIPIDEDVADATGNAEPRHPRRPRPAVTWAASLIGALVIGAVVTAGVMGAAAESGEIRQVATLAVVEDFQAPLFMDPEASSVRGYEDFYGMVVMASDQKWLGPGSDQCLVITAGGDISSQSQAFQGRLFVGCGAGEFPASAQFTVSPGLPRDLIAAFPVGTPLQFVLDGSRVGVFVGQETSVQASGAGG
ncbi:hypothetical protein QSU92_08075 [Microbacterium sp. ET2]|uniref:hypothetical protein n=1 Tax=Microbacterium albipurpureum TaxID=3050384 RepID=UPI00259C993F|nr:hypothetical protein [Microbacterium sp. ET2 (Ac-2212)]WJL97106.1 hypothetical protein QSU92_08075 [Microbacterium sp. ET2 (Ac-2212)]